MKTTKQHKPKKDNTAPSAPAAPPSRKPGLNKLHVGFLMLGITALSVGIVGGTDDLRDRLATGILAVIVVGIALWGGTLAGLTAGLMAAAGRFGISIVFTSWATQSMSTIAAISGALLILGIVAGLVAGTLRSARAPSATPVAETPVGDPMTEQLSEELARNQRTQQETGLVTVRINFMEGLDAATTAAIRDTMHGLVATQVRPGDRHYLVDSDTSALILPDTNLTQGLECSGALLDSSARAMFTHPVRQEAVFVQEFAEVRVNVASAGSGSPSDLFTRVGLAGALAFA